MSAYEQAKSAELFFEYEGVQIYYAYKYNDYEMPPREFWYDTKADSDDDDAFDVRELAGNVEKSSPSFINIDVESEDGQKAIFKEAIRFGLLK